MDPLNSREAFREHRLRIGYTLSQLAKSLGRVHYDSVWHWEQGIRRPNAHHLSGLAKLFGIALTEALRLFWNENIGDPCPCGCGGVKVFPRDYRARHLHIKHYCKRCRKKRIYRDNNGHRMLCNRCKQHGTKRAAKFATVECVGYVLYDESNPRFAETCLERGRKVSRLKSELLSQFRFRTDDPLQYPFVDLKSGQYRCAECGGVPGITRKLQKYIRKVFAEIGEAIGELREYEERRKAREDFHKITGGGDLDPFYPSDNMPRVRNQIDLNERVKQCYRLNYKYKDRSGKKLIFMKGTFKKTRRGRRVSKNRTPGRKLTTFVRKTLRGLCVLCGEAHFSYHDPKMVVHKSPCLNNWRREHCDPGYPPVNGQADTENLERDLIWVIRYKRRESLGKIAEDCGLKKSTIQSEIARARRSLPGDDKVPKRLKKSVSVLRSPDRDL